MSKSVTLTNANSTFKEWHTELEKIAHQQGGFAVDREAWRADYDQGKTPRQSWDDTHSDS